MQVPAFFKPVMELGENLDPPPEVEKVPDPGNAPTPKEEPTYVAPAVAPDPLAPNYDTVKATVPVPRCAPSLCATFSQTPSELRLEMVGLHCCCAHRWEPGQPLFPAMIFGQRAAARELGPASAHGMGSRASRHFQGVIQRCVCLRAECRVWARTLGDAQRAHAAAGLEGRASLRGAAVARGAERGAHPRGKR